MKSKSSASLNIHSLSLRALRGSGGVPSLLRSLRSLRNPPAAGPSNPAYILLGAAFLFTVVLSSCVTFTSVTAVPDTFYYKTPEWTPVCTGIDYAVLEDKALHIKCHLARIDLTESSLELCALPGNVSEGSAPNASVLINTTPFTREKALVGIHKFSSQVYSPAVYKYSALAVNKRTAGSGYTVKVLSNQAEEETALYENVFGGFFAILVNGEPCEFAVESADSRCAAGVSADGTQLIFLAVEGGLFSGSAGLSYQQCASLFSALGCSDALQFDGGSSVKFLVNGKNMLSYPSVVSVPAMFGFILK